MAPSAIAEEKTGTPAPVPPPLPDLKQQAYCTAACDDRCALFKATRTADPAAKKAVFEKWKWREKHGVEFDPEKVFCFGCKAPGKPKNISQVSCSIVPCCRERGLDSCVQCQKLADCDKQLWRNFPKARQRALRQQQQFLATAGFKLI